MKRSGIADLPLHYGHVPDWLANRMTMMGRSITTAIIQEFGQSEFLSRLSDPFWFQALGCVMGMDWHSSGITTSVIGALKRAINPISSELGIYVCGGRGKYSRQTPFEIEKISEKTGLDSTSLVMASKLSAKVDNTCVQDGFSLYLHGFFLSVKGEWAVVQQGMNDLTTTARRYHWHSASVKSFVDDPQSGIEGPNLGSIVNLSDSRSFKAREGIVDFLKNHPEKQLKELRHLTMDRSHEVKPEHVDSKRLGAVLALAYERQFSEFIDALMLPGVGPRTIQALSLVSEVIYGAPVRFEDPARFSFAHGGKDGHPFPVPLKIYDESINVMKAAINKSRVDQSIKVDSLRKLHAFCLYVENNYDPVADVGKVIEHEIKHSKQWGGRTVMDDEKERKLRKKNTESFPQVKQLSLFDD
jgi:hypothetical protein